MMVMVFRRVVEPLTGTTRREQRRMHVIPCSGRATTS